MHLHKILKNVLYHYNMFQIHTFKKYCLLCLLSIISPPKDPSKHNGHSRSSSEDTENDIDTVAHTVSHSITSNASTPSYTVEDDDDKDTIVHRKRYRSNINPDNDGNDDEDYDTLSISRRYPETNIIQEVKNLLSLLTENDLIQINKQIKRLSDTSYMDTESDHRPQAASAGPTATTSMQAAADVEHETSSDHASKDSVGSHESSHLSDHSSSSSTVTRTTTTQPHEPIYDPSHLSDHSSSSSNAQIVTKTEAEQEIRRKRILINKILRKLSTLTAQALALLKTQILDLLTNTEKK